MNRNVACEQRAANNRRLVQEITTIQRSWHGDGPALVSVQTRVRRPKRIVGTGVGQSLQMEEIFQKGFDVLVGFVRRRLLVEAARKSFFITRIAWRKRLLRFAV